MEYNFKMQRVLNRVYKAGIQPLCEDTVWKKKTLDGDFFYGISDFCGLNTENITQYGKELTDLEWDGNELFFSNDNIEELEKKVIATYLGMKRQLEEEYSSIEFDIVVSIHQEEKTGTIRFYTIRDEYHYIEPTHKNVAKFEQEAVLVDTINQLHLDQYIPQLLDMVKGYSCEFAFHGDKELQIVNPYQEEHIYVEWTDEFTMYFSSYHGHFSEEEFEEMLREIECILQGCWVAVTVTCETRWMGSSLWEKESLPLQSPGKLLKQLFTYSKGLLKEVKQKGCVIELTGWNSENNEKIVVDKNDEI